VKIISGIYKGRVLEGFDIDGTRPTMDRVKESLFGMIQNNIPNSTVLDLFSGSGNLGLEALSEGASLAVLVDQNKKAIDTINRNIKNIGISSVKVLWMDYQKALDCLKEDKVKFDVIFLDPPYKTDYIENSINKITENNLLKEDGIMICESDNLNKIIYPSNYKSVKEKKYGDKYIVILKKIC
jgi:16S rRNA (guanine(966)-N(2))-methyltransferase RsmD